MRRPPGGHGAPQSLPREDHTRPTTDKRRARGVVRLVLLAPPHEQRPCSTRDGGMLLNLAPNHTRTHQNQIAAFCGRPQPQRRTSQAQSQTALPLATLSSSAFFHGTTTLCHRCTQTARCRRPRENGPSTVMRGLARTREPDGGIFLQG